MMVMLKLEEQPLLIQTIFNGELEDVKALLAFKPDVNYQDAEKRSPLHAAAYKGDRDLAELLLEQGARVNTKDSNWLTPLHRACGVCAEDTVKLLLKYKADTTARDRQWQTPLHIAAAQNALGCIQHLLSYISNVNVTDRSGCTALHHASLNGHNEVVELLLARGSIVNACDKKDCRPIHWASHAGHVDTVNILIQKGADINVKDRNQYTPLHTAVASGMVYVCSLLLNAGADANAQNAFGNTPLHIACLNGHLSVCQILLAHEVNLEAVNYKGQTALHIAAASTQGVGCLAFLLEQEHIDINKQSQDGRTPLHMSAIYGRFTRSKRLIDKGAVVDRADKNGNTALHIAAQYGHDILTATLLNFGADPVKRGYEGRTPLHACCLSGYVEVCRKFLQREIDLNIIDDRGRTPIHCAAYKGSVECLDLLVSRGGNFKLQDTIGRTPLHYAAVRGHYNCVYTLVGIGSPVNVLDHEGCTALHLAAAFDSEAKCVEYLLAHKADPLLKDCKGYTPVHYAVNGTNRMALELLLKAIGKNVNFLDADMPATTPLHLAARHRDLSILRLIIPYFPETNIKTNEGYTPLLIAAREGYTHNVQMLLRYGAKVAICDDIAGMSPVHHSAKNGHLHCLALLVDNSEVKTVIDRRDKYDRTALMLAISGAHQDCALALLKSDSDPNIVDADLHSSLFRAVVTDQNNVVQLLISGGSNLTEPDVNGKTVLHLAAACGHLKCLQKIMQNVEDKDVLVLDKNGFSALHWACYYGNASCLDYLLQRNIFTKLDGNVFTPVHCAAFTGSERCLELLHTKFGIECLRSTDTRNRSPLHLAAWHGHADCVRFLLDNGADVEARDEIGRSPLISAAQNGQSQVIDLLLAHKADLKAADVNGNSALHVACLRKHNHTALLLLEYINDVAVVNMADNDKKTALHLSARNGLVEVTAELIKKGASVVATDNNGLTPALYCAPNACVAQCLAIILAHHPTEIVAGGLHTKECLKLIRKLSRTSPRSAMSVQSSQTEISLLRSPHELFLIALAKQKKRRHSHTLITSPPFLNLSAAASAPLKSVPSESKLQKSSSAPLHVTNSYGPCFPLNHDVKDDKKVILIEDYDKDEFDASNLRQTGFGLHRSYSEMTLSAPDTMDFHKNNNVEMQLDDDDDIHLQNYDRVRDDESMASFQKLINGYKTIALKMANVRNKFDVSIDDIHRAYLDTRRRLSGPNITSNQRSKSEVKSMTGSVSCPQINQKRRETSPRSLKTSEKLHLGSQHHIIQKADIRQPKKPDAVNPFIREKEALVILAEQTRFQEKLCEEMEDMLHQEGRIDSENDSGSDIEADEEIEDTRDASTSYSPIIEHETKETDVSFTTCGLPSFAPVDNTPVPSSLPFASYAKVVTQTSTTSTDDVCTATSTDALGHGDFLYENFCSRETPRSYCDCQYVCKNCVLLNRYDFYEGEADSDLLGIGHDLFCSEEGSPYRHRFNRRHSSRHVGEVNDEEEEEELIPLENLMEPEVKVFVGEGAIRKTRHQPEEIRFDAASSSSTPEKLMALSKKCEAEKARRKQEQLKQEQEKGQSRDVSPDRELQIEELDINLDCLDSLNFNGDDFLDVGETVSDLDVAWPKVTFDEGCVKMPKEIEGSQACDDEQDLQGSNEEDGPTRDLDWSLFTDFDDLELGATAKLKASVSMTNVACASSSLNEYDDMGMGLNCVTSCTFVPSGRTSDEDTGRKEKIDDYLSMATSSTEMESVCDESDLLKVQGSRRGYKGVIIEEVVDREVKEVPRKTPKIRDDLQETGTKGHLPPGAITSLASSFMSSKSSPPKKFNLQPSGLTLNEIPSTLLSTDSTTCLLKEANTKLRDSAAIVDFSALFPKASRKLGKLGQSKHKIQQAKVEERICDDSSSSSSNYSTPRSPSSPLSSPSPRDGSEREKEILNMIHHAHDKIKKFSYQEMIDLSEGLNMSNEAKAVAKRLIEQYARKQKLLEQHNSTDSIEASEMEIENKLSDHGSDSGNESLNTNSMDSVPSSPGFWDINSLEEGVEHGDEVDTVDSGIVNLELKKSKKKFKRQDDNKCRLQ